MTRRQPCSSPRRLSSRRLRPVLWAITALVVVAPSAGLAVAAGAATTSEECQTVITDMGTDLGTLPKVSAKSTTADLDALKQKAGEIFSKAQAAHPSCENAIARFQAQLVANARKAATIKGTPFWGPIGWAWNNVYYKVFSGNDIMMAMFGWALMLSPFILAFSLVWVLRGAEGAFHRPYVPPHLKTER